MDRVPDHSFLSGLTKNLAGATPKAASVRDSHPDTHGTRKIVGDGLVGKFGRVGPCSGRLPGPPRASE